MSLLHDLRSSSRTLFKHPAFAIITTLILALGIGANTTIFSVVNTVLMRPLPYEDPDRIVMIWETNHTKGIPRSIVSPANFLDWRKQNQVFEDLAAFRFWYYTVTGSGDPERYQGARVSANFFPLLRVKPEIGRNFAPEEEQVGRDHVVLLTHGLWQRRFGGNPNVIGQPLTIDGESFSIIGVLPASFRFIRVLNAELELWMPISFAPEQLTREDHSIIVYGRLKQGVSLAQAQAQMDGITNRLAQACPETNTGWGAQVNNLHEQAVKPVRPILLILMTVVGFVLLIACANVANLLLTRATSRQKEIAIRLAMGSSRYRLMRQLITESLMLALLGGAAGLLLAYLAVDVLNAIVPENRLPRLERFSLDLRVLGFTLLVSILVGVIVGLIPGLRASRLNLSETLKEGGRVGSEAPSGRRLRNLFVVLETTLTVPLLISAGLMLRSSPLLQNIDRGMNINNVLTMQISLPKAKYSTAEQTAAFYQQTLQRIQTEPGVESASAVNVLPLTNLEDATRVDIEGVNPPPPGQEITVGYRVIDQNYFRTLGIPLLGGRYVTEQDNDESHGVVMINKTMAHRYWPNEDPVGRRLKPQFPAAKVPWRPESSNAWLTIVGVVGDVKEEALNDETKPEIYVPYLQNPSSLMNVLVRSTSDPVRLAPRLRSDVLAVDRDQPVSNINTMENVFSQSLAEPKVITSLLATFAALALVLAGLGVYSVVSYSVAQRTHEIGVRIALGAQQRHVLRIIVGQGLTLVLAGVAIGLAAALAVTRVLSNLLFGVTATDPPIFLVVPLLLVVVAILASYLPARRALKVDPIVALHNE
ncbi:MAG TPA: ABC transporter permease [Pyrinomonadaceae bacterium]|nr:ABC transporter permease [Pyrinomonadaceae bacterium]